MSATPNRAQHRPGRFRYRRLAIAMAAVLAVVLLGSCTHLGYYSQSLSGGAGVLLKRRDVAAVIADPTTEPELRRKLEVAQAMRKFAVDELILPDNKSYRTYADLGRPYAVWNVVAAPEFSIAPRTWCFMIVGCVAYRGYFSEAKAEKFAAKMEGQGYDVDMGGVSAYSTIGWFADPLLNTFIERPEEHLAGLLFHELAHQVVYVKGDTTFNESFAMAVEGEGAARWMAQNGQHDRIESYRLYKKREREFSELVLSYRERLAEIYAADLSPEIKRERKAAMFDRLLLAYAETKEGWDGYSGFDGWFDKDLNNARLALIGAYHEYLPAFERLLERHRGQMEPFYAEVRQIGGLEAEERRERMEELMSEGGVFPGVAVSPVPDEAEAEGAAGSEELR